MNKLKNWSQWKLINIHGHNHYNDYYYIGNISTYCDIYLAICPNTKGKRFEETHGNEPISMLISRDGINWEKTHDNIIPKNYRGLPVSQTLIEQNNKLYQFMHNCDDESIDRYVINKDRFGSIYSNNRGYIKTNNFILDPTNLYINCRTGDDGYILVQIRDTVGSRTTDFSFEDCNPIAGDHYKYHVRWNTDKTLTKKEYNIELILNNAEVFALYY